MTLVMGRTGLETEALAEARKQLRNELATVVSLGEAVGILNALEKFIDAKADDAIERQARWNAE